MALAQLAPRLGEVDANFELAADRVRAAAAEGAALTVFPELALTGYLLQDLVPDVAMPADDPRLSALSAAAPGMLLTIGFVEETADHRFCNSAALLRDGELLGLHRKVYLPTYGLFDEGRFTSAGDRIRTFEVGPPLGRIGVSVCEDFWHPALPYLLWLDGADTQLMVAAGPGRGVKPGDDYLDTTFDVITTHRIYAELFTSFIVHCNRVGYEDGVAFGGYSTVMAPDGAFLARGEHFEECLVTATINPEALRFKRRSLPLLRDERPQVVLRELQRIVDERYS